MSHLEHLKLTFTKKKVLHCILFAGLPALLFYVSFLLGLGTAGFGIVEILRDPAQQSGQSSFLGFLSNIGIWLWISSAAICFFSASIGKSSHGKLLFLVGILSMLLAIDDFFLIHDRYVNQNLCYLLYAILAGTLFTVYLKEILEIDGFSFLSAGLLLAMSILTDVVQGRLPITYSHAQVIEEGFKFVGIAMWLYFSCRIASFSLKPSKE